MKGGDMRQRFRACMQIAMCVIAVGLLYAPTPSWCAPVAEHVLSNGLKVLVVEDHKAPLATFQIWYRVGSMDEPAGKTGVSHLLEHMMFKGTPRYGSKVFSNLIQRNGGVDNAQTSKDYTMYYQTLSSDRVTLSIELESDRMTNLLLDLQDVLSERDVVKEERRMRYEDDPQNLLFEDVIATAFKAHPYSWPVIGWMSDIANLQREDLARHYRRFYAPHNAFIVISGAVRAPDVLPLVEKAFGALPRGEAEIARTATQEPEQMGERRVYLRKEAELPYVLMAYHTPSFPHEDSYALDVLAAILSSGRSSRLYSALVYDNRLAINVFADYSGFHRAPFLFFLGGTAAPGKEAEDVEAALLAETAKITGEPPSESEVQKAKNQVEVSFVFAQDSTYTRAFYTGMFELLGGWRLMDKYLEGIRRVTPSDVQAAARKYLSPDRRTTGTLVPLPRPAAGKGGGA